MENKDKKNDRISRLQALLDTHFNGRKDELGKFLGYKDGAFVRQMLSGSRPISEKTVDKTFLSPTSLACLIFSPAKKYF